MTQITEGLVRLPAAAFTLLLLSAAPTAAQTPATRTSPPEQCRAAPASPDAHEWIARAAAAVRIPDPGTGVLRYQASTTTMLRDQSDRTYPPFIAAAAPSTRVFDAATGVEWSGAPDGSRGVLSAARSTWVKRGDAVAESRTGHTRTQADRYLDPWAVITDWAASPGTVEASCTT